MTDDKNKLGYHDRSRVSGDQECEVGWIDRSNLLVKYAGAELIAKHGNDRETLEREAKNLKGR
ncbi:DUF3606 domain-containing protein [Mesorhizobium sp. B2-3-14]|uniref:DUF3606 domain-containing protein n=1 Tax=unclassified Mesorhizobium TaxID=325217 RepID=UPI0011298489|nr:MULTISPECIES: DUF3606 domain-containing protein [unclassified Mesorhizobium]TPK72359.1 DUF3606 domain-containing protein [Mesorhizobium sp. B2-4-18]TPL88120.1 DUF3606 domain-containing protein [Mesorhizobium sp. B2-3-14]